MEILESGSVTSPKGFLAAGQHVGIKKQDKDLALIYSQVPAVTAGAFTTNVIQAAPVTWSRQVVQRQQAQAIVVNSGNANACTGTRGDEHAAWMADAAGRRLGVEANQVLVASTGVIGVPLPIEVVLAGIENTAELLADSVAAGLEAAQAIRTTDTMSKHTAVKVQLSTGTVTVGGIAKGSGMIHPNMATMLSFITTDAAINPELLSKALRESTAGSYNMISVDGDTSTNDMVVALANGMAENKPIDSEDEDYQRFFEALHTVNTYLAQQIVRDGEGATKFLEVRVQGARDDESARKLAKSVITSNLVKTAFFGEDANWGRIVAALGYAGVEFAPSEVGIVVESAKGTLNLLRNGEPLEFDEAAAQRILHERDIQIFATVGQGFGKAVAWGCDFSYDYVKINGSYRT
ncbi:bifunctional glutamate N-acetyltransferase/amino-acid acetyltransferase ArgJ [Alicyclobacillus tolerans]|uniref:bifunctional glutamate N-acetyltransferase/amino-acid acetyltransferase ArgJ n=1 Tax=Alicyclobacillus tolerans TaxID=90970 RepID=UPI001F019A99|nr:bifunctional glutamate N-acetyltransferase/amino-acid acetyltransferase ArgJ [Alicyclobacillus tolerans]MCF8563479.1 bifunctional glutamate N-acetyltransferase/amino-acid acetyltransferase ArgJ [Alicyclobacillus tolerans]